MNRRLLSVGEAEKKARELLEDDNIEELFELAYGLLKQENVFGAENDYHNFSLNYSRKSAYDLACEILDRGLKQFPKSVDLLADYLQAGINCSRVDQCEEHFNTLMQIPKTRWTWRGFSFAIDYLLYLSNSLNESELTAMKERTLSLADEYCRYFPTSEDPYICKSDIYNFYNDHEAVKDILIDAMNTVSVCPKCALRLADLLFDEGAYENSLSVLSKCLYQSIQTPDSVNHGYLYFLSGLCKTVLLLREATFENKDQVLDIYNDFSIAQKAGLQHASYLRVMRRQIDILEIRSGVEYPD